MSDNLLVVVDAKISNLTGETYIHIYRAGRTGIENTNLGDYDVNVISDTDETYTFTAQDFLFSDGTTGIYKPDDPSFIGEVGKAYRLEITSPNDFLITSVYDTIRESVDFDMIITDTTDLDFDIEKSAKAVIIAINSDNNDYFSKFRFDLSYVDHYVASGVQLPSVFGERTIELSENFLLYQCEDEQTCAMGKREVLQLIQRRNWLFALPGCPDGFPCDGSPCCTYFDSYVTKFTITQETLSRETFNFWKEVEPLLNNDGLIFDTYPFPINGNITCEECPFEVIGQLQTVSTIKKSQDVLL